MKLVFATNNNHKLKEVRQLVPGEFEILSLRDIDSMDELPETGVRLEDNARQKARYIREKFGMDCFADDTGLEVDALAGRPGVYSARYAGQDATAEENIFKLLNELKDNPRRSARFRTVIALILDNAEYLFEGIIEGEITPVQKGSGGFGYDSVFIPQGYTQTFAEMSPAEKNAISHRAKAIEKLNTFLTDFIRRKSGVV